MTIYTFSFGYNMVSLDVFALDPSNSVVKMLLFLQNYGKSPKIWNSLLHTIFA